MKNLKNRYKRGIKVGGALKKLASSAMTSVFVKLSEHHFIDARYITGVGVKKSLFFGYNLIIRAIVPRMFTFFSQSIERKYVVKHRFNESALNENYEVLRKIADQNKVKQVMDWQE